MKHIRLFLAAIVKAIRTIPFNQYFFDLIDMLGDLLHNLLFNLLLPKQYRNMTKQQIFTVIFKSDTPAGKKFDIWLLAMIAANIVVIIAESMADTAQWFAITMRVLGWGFTLLFTFEYYLRIYCLKKPSRYLFSFWGIIDFLSIAPPYLSLFFPALSSMAVLRLMRMLRIFRIFKMQRFLNESHLLMNALRRSAVKILIFMLFVFLMAVVLGALMYGIEGGKNGELNSIPKGIYWAVVTITTVGYGDISPVTPLGQWVSMLVMLLGYSVIAVPTGIVAGETYYEHNQRRHKKKNKFMNPEVEPRQRRQAQPAQQPKKDNERRYHLREHDPGARADAEDLM